MSVTWASNFALTLAPANSPITVPLLVVACSFSGLLIVSNVVAVSLRQSITPDHLLGRMNATYKFVSYGALSVGAFIGGLIGDLIGLRGAMVVAGIGLLSTVLVALIRPLRGLRELPAPLDEPAAPAPTAVSVLADA
jgi:predicted MFS family arabinose efflux permease